MEGRGCRFFFCDGQFKLRKGWFAHFRNNCTLVRAHPDFQGSSATEGEECHSGTLSLEAIQLTSAANLHPVFISGSHAHRRMLGLPIILAGNRH